MELSIDEVVDLLKRSFPDMLVLIADGGNDYLVGTVEDAEETIFASFSLTLDSSGNRVTEISLGKGERYCGSGVQSNASKTSRFFVPFSITRREMNGEVWGMVGDYEVCVNSETIEMPENLASGM